jgi:O-antigen/teichoic acid export membrane protein
VTAPADSPAPAAGPPPAPSLAVAAAGSTMWSLASQVGQTLAGFATTMLLTFWLSPADYGVYGMASTAALLLGVLGDGGIGSALLRRPAIDDAVETTAFFMAMAGGLALTALALAAAPAIGAYFGSREVGAIAALLAANFLLLGPGRVSFAKLGRALRFRAQAIAGISASIVASGVSLVLAAGGAGAVSLAVAYLVAPALLTVMFIAAAPPRVAPRLFSRPLARELSAFGARISGYSVAVSVAWFPLLMLLGKVTDAAAVGLFNMATRLVVYAADRIAAAFCAVFLPSVAQLAPEERQRVYLATLRTLAMCTAPVALGAFAVADELVVVLPARWAGLAPTLKGLALGAAVEPLAMLPATLLTAEGRPRTVMRLGLLMIPVAWAGVGLAAWQGSLAAFVAAWLAINLVGVVVYFAAAAGGLRRAGPSLRAVGVPLLAAALMSAGVEALQWATGTAGRAPGLPLGIGAGLALYLAAARVLLRHDLGRALRLVGSALRRR